MIKGFPIDFVRATFEQTLLEQHLKNINFYGGRNQVRIFSLYEQLLKGEDVDRYKENFEDLATQQNRSDLILNGVVTAPTNPTITNLYSCTIIPLEYVCSLRCNIENREQSLETINNLIEELKGSKVDIAELKCADENGSFAYVPFIVGTIGHNEGAPQLKNGDYIGDVSSVNDVVDLVNALPSKGVDRNNGASWLYCGHQGKIKVAKKDAGHPFICYDATINSHRVENGKVIASVDLETESADYTQIPLYVETPRGTLKLTSDNSGEEDVTCTSKIESVEIVSGHVVWHLTCTCNNVFGEHLEDVTWADIEISEGEYSFIEDDGTYHDIIFPPEHVSFTKYKMSVSFEALRCDEPANLEDGEYVRISFGGSATLTNDSILFGNDLVKVCISKYGLKRDSGNIVYSNPTKHWLEPLEMPSGNNPNTRINQLVSNNFKANSHTDAITLVLQYSFLIDLNESLLSELFEYGRYGTININASSDIGAMSPNLIYTVTEYWSYWGNIRKRDIKTKIGDSIDIEDTESDTMTLGITMQIQGDND